MALLEGFKLTPGTRSNTRLRVSNGDSPAEKWIVDPTLPILFDYKYGGPGQTDVVVSKGMAVALSGDFYKDHTTGKFVPIMTIADGVNAVVGMAPFNFAKHDPAFLRGNQPTLVTREYVELPYIPDAAEAANVKWGAVHGAGLKPGDMLKASTDPLNKGKLTKWVEGTDAFSQMVGQILGVETDQEPLGWLKWAMWDEVAKYEDDAWVNLNKSVIPGDHGYPYDPDYRSGTIDMPGYLTDMTTNPTGIPGLTDGANRNLTVYTYTRVVSAAEANTTIAFNVGKVNLIEVTSATLGATDVKANLVVNKKDGAVAYLVPSSVAADTNLVVKFRVNHPGTLPGWDYKGSLGAIRLLLKF